MIQFKWKTSCIHRTDDRILRDPDAYRILSLFFSCVLFCFCCLEETEAKSKRHWMTCGSQVCSFSVCLFFSLSSCCCRSTLVAAWNADDSRRNAGDLRRLWHRWLTNGTEFHLQVFVLYLIFFSRFLAFEPVFQLYSGLENNTQQYCLFAMWLFFSASVCPIPCFTFWFQSSCVSFSARQRNGFFLVPGSRHNNDDVHNTNPKRNGEKGAVYTWQMWIVGGFPVRSRLSVLSSVFRIPHAHIDSFWNIILRLHDFFFKPASCSITANSSLHRKGVI